VKVIVLGSGKIGSIMAREFASIVGNAKLTMADIDEARAKDAASAISGADWVVIDTTDYQDLVSKLKGYDLVLGALPGDYGYMSIQAAIEARANMVDVSYTVEDPTELDALAKEKGVTVVPDCGVAPGLSNILVGYAASRLDKVKTAHFMVGGIPEKPVPPLEYTITWSADGLIDEYVRDVSIITGGKKVTVPALSGLEEIEFPGVGTLESFYTDGLRTLATSIEGVDSMWEKTLRYPGHVEKVKLLRELGFFDDEPVKLREGEVVPKFVTARLFERTLWMPEVGDLLAMRVEVSGKSGEEDKTITYVLVDYFNHETGVSAMARTTGYTAAIVAGMLAKGYVTGKGVLVPELLAERPRFTETLLAELRGRGVNVKEA
jgi:saccharopine dehydrogenase-like NADP-dependent oxidoreductase